MAERTIRLYGDPILRSVCTPVSEFGARVATLVKDLSDTAIPEGRAAVAAPQIGADRRIFAYHLQGRVGYVINPEITALEGELVDVTEGCLSVPGLSFPTPRWEFATCEGFDLEGAPITVSGEGVFAQMLQHETDHLNGTVYIETLPPPRRRDALRAVRTSEWFMKSAPTL